MLPFLFLSYKPPKLTQDKKNGGMCPLDTGALDSSQRKQGYNPRMKNNCKVCNPTFFIVPDIAYQFQKTCIKEISLIEWKANAGWTDGHTDMGKT